MVSLEQVKLLESKVIKALEYIDQVTEENTRLREKLELNQKRIDGLEIVVQRFKEEQNRIEEGIVSALNRLSRFEADIEKSLAPEKFREDSAHDQAVRTDAKELPNTHKRKGDGDKAAEEAVETAEGKPGDESMLEPAADDLSGNEETSDEALSPGELDIF
ncbi:MAG: cell division protein ZapB [Treponema sp.]|jgi:NACalpha-BTF3-like transcription factor|nr:cell division protein ZapB [Treponema sp.]